MIEMTQEQIQRVLDSQRNFFATNQTKDIDFRLQCLKKFKKSIMQRESQIEDALWLDLHKSKEEAYLTEISIVLSELDNHIKHLRRWTKEKQVSTPLHLFPSRSSILYEPLGIALIIAPWNYPFHLLMNPLVGAISSGCCAVLKSSPYAPNTNRVMKELIQDIFPENYVAFMEGHREVNQLLLEQRFDFIFFTGSPHLGRTVLQAAASYLTPVILELGGKSPCVVDRDANLPVAARRIMWGKTINAGQTCVAPDYLFVHRDVKEPLLREMKLAVRQFFGNEPQQSPYYARIVNERAMQRLLELLQRGKIVFGGEFDRQDRYIAPTVLEDIVPDDPIMQEEIFGPLLPVMTYENIDDVLEYINRGEKPLAFYYFGKNDCARTVLSRSTSGGVCINDTLMHIANHHLPFGGVGNSGMGKYHGRRTFLAFSNERAVIRTPTLIDLPMKYVPFRWFSWIKRLL